MRWLAGAAWAKLTQQDRAIGRKNFRGTLWDRLRGLEHLSDDCRDRTVLDIASCEGLISYELVRQGARLVHGLERDKDRVIFSRRLFRDVPVESSFQRADLSVSGSVFSRRYGNDLLDQYDIVLFLGIYHHLQRQMPEEQLFDLVIELLRRTAIYFVVRTKCPDDIEPVILSQGFELLTAPTYDGQRNGLLRIYKRIDGRNCVRSTRAGGMDANTQ